MQLDIRPKTDNQRIYYQAMVTKRIVICTGPPGTGKTLTALGYALASKKDIVLTRPTVSACGEELGFIPGDIKDKMFPFLYVFDQYLKELGVKGRTNVEKWPLAFMKGLTFKDKIVILDEAQNATYDQIKMLLTRIGEGTKILINGDTEQTDINNGGLLSVAERLNGQPWFRHCVLGEDDILRDPLVREICRLLE